MRKEGKMRGRKEEGGRKGRWEEAEGKKVL
jgi:hypothetical protein